MNNEITVKEIASELGLKNRDIIKKAKDLGINIKSFRSKVSEEEAQKIFDEIMFGSKIIQKQDKDGCLSNDKIKLYFSTENLDMNFLRILANFYKEKYKKDFIIFSRNFSDIEILKIFATGLGNMDIDIYLVKNYSKDELELLQKNLNTILEDVDYDKINFTNPIQRFRLHVESYKPKLAIIEGVDYNANSKEVDEFLNDVLNFTKEGIEFEIGFINIPKEKFEKFQQDIMKKVCQK